MLVGKGPASLPACRLAPAVQRLPDPPCRNPSTCGGEQSLALTGVGALAPLAVPPNWLARLKNHKAGCAAPLAKERVAGEGAPMGEGRPPWTPAAGNEKVSRHRHRSKERCEQGVGTPARLREVSRNTSICLLRSAVKRAGPAGAMQCSAALAHVWIRRPMERWGCPSSGRS